MCFMQQDLKFSEIEHIIWLFASFINSNYTHTNRDTQHTQIQKTDTPINMYIILYLL